MKRMISNKKETYEEFILRLLVKTLTFFTMGILLIILLVIQRKERELEKFESQIDLNKYSIMTERIPVKEMMTQYINNLSLPISIEKSTSLVEEKNIHQVKKDKVMSDLAAKVKNSTPIIQMFDTSAYCACEKCCGKTDGITASQEKAKQWLTIAAGREYKFGTIIYIPELADNPNGGWFIVQDRGEAITNNKLDIYMNSHNDAIQYGRKNLECYVYEIN